MERSPVTRWIRGWVSPRAVLDAVVKRKIPSHRRESNPRTPIVQPVAQLYTDWAITAILKGTQFFIYDLQLHIDLLFPENIDPRGKLSHQYWASSSRKKSLVPIPVAIRLFVTTKEAASCEAERVGLETNAVGHGMCLHRQEATKPHPTRRNSLNETRQWLRVDSSFQLLEIQDGRWWRDYHLMTYPMVQRCY
jgi:hypothetical protein